MNSSKMMGNFPAVLNFFNRLFLKLNRFIVTNCRFPPIIGWKDCIFFYAAIEAHFN